MSRVIGLTALFLIVLTGRGIVLKNADNVEITSGKLSLSHITIYEISNPRKGTWTLTVPGSNGDHEFSVKSSSDSNADFDHYFLITLSWRRRSTEVPVSNPVVGKPLSFLEVDKIFSVVGEGVASPSSYFSYYFTSQAFSFQEPNIRQNAPQKRIFSALFFNVENYHKTGTLSPPW